MAVKKATAATGVKVDAPFLVVVDGDDCGDVFETLAGAMAAAKERSAKEDETIIVYKAITCFETPRVEAVERPVIISK